MFALSFTHMNNFVYLRNGPCTGSNPYREKHITCVPRHAVVAVIQPNITLTFCVFIVLIFIFIHIGMGQFIPEDLYIF